MSATVTIGKRRAGMPSERGSMYDTLLAAGSERIREFADALRKRRSSQQESGFPHRIGVLADSLRPVRGEYGSRQPRTRRTQMDSVVADVKKQVGTQIKRARWAL